MRNGPTKIILINAGKYDYAEVALDGAIQIVGDNNWGKTTLINTLQFLYFDDRTKFGLGTYTPDETLEYYFNNEHSYVLFECRTLRGQAVIGWRGASKTSGADPERFAYLGPFRREDYFAPDNHLRKPREISANLADREFQLLAKPAEHRAVLLAGTGPRNNGLGIVALNDGERFSDFRETFRNLLNLTHIRQEQMRERLLMLAGLPTDYVAIDARRVLGEDYEELKSEKLALKQFQSHEQDIHQIITLFNDRQALWGQLNYRWNDLKARKQRFDEDHTTRIQTLTQKLTTAHEAATKTKDSLRLKRDERERLLEQKAPIDAQLKKLETDKRIHGSFAEQLEQTIFENLDRQLKDLLDRQQEASTETPESVRNQLHAVESKTASLRNSIQHFSRLAVTALREHFTDDEISRLFRVLNPDLLGLATGRGGITTSNPKAVVGTLRELLARTTDGVYQDAAITVRLAPASDVLARFQNIETLEKELGRETRNLDRLTSLLEAVTKREATEQRIDTLRKQRQAQQDKLSAYKQFQRELANEAEWRQTVQTLNTALNTSKKEIDDLDSALEDHRKQLSSFSGEKNSVEAQYRAILTRYDECHGKIAIFNAAPRADAEIPEDFDSAVALYLNEHKRQADFTRDFQASFSHLGVFADRYKSNDEAESMRNLEQELDALAQREEALNLRWKSHLQGLKGRFQEVMHDLRLIESARDRLNREFARVQISDLRAVKLTVERHADEVSLIERLATVDELSLLDDHSPLEKIFERVQAKMDRNPVTRIAELFTLGVTVTRADGSIRKHPDIHQVESDGTTVTFKVLFNLLVLKSLLHKDDVAVPFFLDEIERLDPANQRAIIQTAKKLGFIAITAAPTAVGEVDVCYFLEPDERGRVVLTDVQRLSLKTKAQSNPYEP